MNMEYRLYDTREILSEEIEKFDRNVRKFGKLVKLTVKFLFAFVLFLLLNVLLDYVTHHAKLLSLNSFHLLEEGLRVFINENLLSFVSILNQHVVCQALVIAVAIVTEISLIVEALGQVAAKSSDSREEHKHDRLTQSSVSQFAVVGYKQKVCFLS